MARGTRRQVDATPSFLQTLQVPDYEREDSGGHGSACTFDARGPFTLLCPPEIGDLIAEAAFCTHPGCPSRLVQFRGQLAPLGGACIPVDFSIEVDAGYVLVHHDDRQDQQVAACLEEAADWLDEHLSSIMLDGLHQRLVEAKGRTLDPAAWKKLDWSWWAPGSVVAWREVEPDGRVDLFVVRERCYAAMDYYCANPGCDCAEVQVVFLTSDGTANRAKLGAVTFSLPDGRQKLISELAGATAEQLAELGGLFLRRYGAQRLAERHQRVRHEVGIEIHRLYSGATDAVPRATAGRKVGPNERCPCGSGKKFKRCCRSPAR